MNIRQMILAVMAAMNGLGSVFAEAMRNDNPRKSGTPVRHRTGRYKGRFTSRIVYKFQEGFRAKARYLHRKMRCVAVKCTCGFSGLVKIKAVKTNRPCPKCDRHKMSLRVAG